MPAYRGRSRLPQDKPRARWFVSRCRVLKRRPALPAGGAGFALRGRATVCPQSVNSLLWVSSIVTGMSDSLDRLYAAVLAARTGDPATSRTARLLRSGRSKMAKKLAEEAVEVVIDAMHGHSDAVV